MNRLRIKELILISLLILTFSFSSKSQKVFEVKYKNEADVVIFITQNLYDADLKVYVTQYPSDVNGFRGIWYFTKYEYDADLKIYYTKYRSEANLIIYLTKYRSDAGWRKK